MGADDDDVEDTEKPGVAEGFGAPALLRCIISCAAEGPDSHKSSFLSGGAIMVWCGMIPQDDNLWE